LELKGIDYEYKSISLIKNGGEQVFRLLKKKNLFSKLNSEKKFSEEYTKLNPKQEVPTIEIDGLLLTQSVNYEILQ
jgi:hypothetical protein